MTPKICCQMWFVRSVSFYFHYWTRASSDIVVRHTVVWELICLSRRSIIPFVWQITLQTNHFELSIEKCCQVYYVSSSRDKNIFRVVKCFFLNRKFNCNNNTGSGSGQFETKVKLRLNERFRNEIEDWRLDMWKTNEVSSWNFPVTT